MFPISGLTITTTLIVKSPNVSMSYVILLLVGNQNVSVMTPAAKGKCLWDVYRFICLVSENGPFESAKVSNPTGFEMRLIPWS